MLLHWCANSLFVLNICMCKQFVLFDIIYYFQPLYTKEEEDSYRYAVYAGYCRGLGKEHSLDFKSVD